jgi:hypothetical protein
MLKASALIGALLIFAPPYARAQSGEAPTDSATGLMLSCTASCHGPSLISQQRLTRDAWAREVEKMIGWGALVSPANKTALINYLALTFNASRPRPNTARAMPDIEGKDVFQLSCMGCHDQQPVSSLKRDAAGWSLEVEKMIRWGAYVPSARKNELMKFLMTVKW